MTARRIDLVEGPGYREALRTWAAALKDGAVTAFATDTVWGIGALPSLPDAIERIYEIKGRDQNKAVACLVPGPEQAVRWTEEWPEPVLNLVRQHWPGALTIVAASRGEPFPAIQRGVPKLGFRMPDRRSVLDLLELIGEPLAATSANRSGQPELGDVEEVMAELGSQLDVVVSDGRPVNGRASTVVEWTGRRLQLLRAGAVPLPSS